MVPCYGIFLAAQAKNIFFLTTGVLLMVFDEFGQHLPLRANQASRRLHSSFQNLLDLG